MADGLKDRDLQDYYESMQRMFETPGWKYLTEDLMKLLEAADKLDGIEHLQALFFRKGQIDILNTVIAQPAVISAAYDMLLESEDDAKVV